MDFMTLWGIIGIIAYFCLSVKDFRKSDWGIKKEFLTAKNREKWQKNNAIYELGIASFGTLAMLSDIVLENTVAFLIFGVVTLALFFLSIFNEKLMKKQ